MSSEKTKNFLHQT